MPRGNFHLICGAKLHFDPKFPADHNNVYEKYRGQEAEFLHHRKFLVGILDHEGRRPGTYEDFENFTVRFGDKAEHVLNCSHFVVQPGPWVQHEILKEQQSPYRRLGDLLHPILFYPGDKVWVKGQPGFLERVMHKVDKVIVGNEIHDGTRYFVLETEDERVARNSVGQARTGKAPFLNRLSDIPEFMVGLRQHQSDGTDLTLAERGNVWALYNDPSKLEFASDKKELEFWIRDGISYRFRSTNPEELKLKVDFVYRGSDHSAFPSAWRLYDCFAVHRERVRKLSNRLDVITVDDRVIA